MKSSEHNDEAISLVKEHQKPLKVSSSSNSKPAKEKFKSQPQIDKFIKEALEMNAKLKHQKDVEI